MLYFTYEKSHVTIDAQRSNPRGTDSLCQEYPLCKNWDKDSGNATDSGGSEAGVGIRSSRGIKGKHEQMDTFCEQGWTESIRMATEVWTSMQTDRETAGETGKRLRDIPDGSRDKPDTLGWSHSGSVFEKEVWDIAEGTPGTILDASAWISVKESQLYLYSGKKRSREKVSIPFKKNSRRWDIVKQ